MHERGIFVCYGMLWPFTFQILELALKIESKLHLSLRCMLWMLWTANHFYLAVAGPWLAGSRRTWDTWVVSDFHVDLRKIGNPHFHMLMFFPMKLVKYPWKELNHGSHEP